MEIAGYSGFDLLGRGGFSSVYRAHQAAQSRDVAVKVLTVDVSDDASRARFERECAANGRLGSHPNVMTVFGSGYTDEGRPYISMELCSGGSLAERLANGVMPVDEVLRVGIKIAGAVETAHRNGITHRDIKPENILVTSFGEYVLADFGISALENVRSGTATAGSFTLSHVPPEVLQGEVSGVPGDVYSLGSTLYRLLTGRPPFADETTPLAVAITRTLNDPLPDPGSGVPASFTRVLESSMSKEPARRPSTALEFASMLQDVQRELGVAVTDAVVAPLASGAEAAGPRDAEVPSASESTSTPTPTRQVNESPVPAAPAASMETVPPAAEPAPRAASGRDVTEKRRLPVPVAAVVALVVLATGAVVVLGRGSGSGDAAVGTTETATPASAPGTTQAGQANPSPTEKTTSTVGTSKASGSGSTKTVPVTSAPTKKSSQTKTTSAPTTLAPAATNAPATTVPVTSTTTPVKVNITVTIPKITIVGCLTRQACAQALVNAWIKNDVSAARDATTGVSNYQAVTKLFEYPYATYGSGFNTTVAKVNDVSYQITSTRATAPYKFLFLFESTATVVKVGLTAPIITK